MKIGLYQMVNHGMISLNYCQIREGIIEAHENNCDLVVFPECALTGYPPVETKIDLNSMKNDIDLYEKKLRKDAKDFNIYLIFGTIRFDGEKRYNTLKVINREGKVIEHYDKRALWGYDLQNFEQGHAYKSVYIDNLHIGLSICFEIRFPEFYRQHRINNVDLMLTCFCDISAQDNPSRYDLIKGHIQTRAVENILTHLTVNSASIYQTAPTGIFDIYGYEILRTAKHVNELLVYTYERQELSYGAKGILEISKNIMK